MSNSTASRITLKNFSSMESLSEETLCFTATVFVDGKLLAAASNHGHGGSTSIGPTIGGPDFNEIRIIEALFAATLPSVMFEGFELKGSLESVVDDIANRMHFEKGVKSELRSKVLAQDPATKKLYMWSRKHKGQNVTDRLYALIAEKNPAYIVLNKLPISEAADLYSASK